MRKQIDLIYNPLSREASLRIDGVSYAPADSRLSDFMLGRDIDSWLSFRTESYRRWNGFLCELICELNDDELDLTFHGEGSDYRRLLDELPAQQALINETGFSIESCTFSHREAYNAAELAGRMLAMRAAHRENRCIPPTQMLMMKMDVLDEQLENPDDLDAAGLFRLHAEIVQLYRQSARQCPDRLRPRWENALREMQKVID